MNYGQLLKYVNEAIGVYGTGPGTPALNTGNYVVVPVADFKAASPHFQAALYKDPATGRYRIAFAGTNDLAGDLAADGVLATQDIAALARTFVGDWHPQMSDALDFAFEAFKQIRTELRRMGVEKPTLDQIRAQVDVTGHSLGGAESELASQFFGLKGFNIDGPGVQVLTQHTEFAAMKQIVRQEFPDLQEQYEFQPGDFTANSFSVVGTSGRHAEGVVHAATPDAAVSYPVALVAAASAPFIGPLGLVAGVFVAGASAATRHPAGDIVARAEQALGLSVNEQPAVDWGLASTAPELEYYRANFTAPRLRAPRCNGSIVSTPPMSPLACHPMDCRWTARHGPSTAWRCAPSRTRRAGVSPRSISLSMRPASPSARRFARNSPSPPTAASRRSTTRARPSSSPRDRALPMPRSRLRDSYPSRTAAGHGHGAT